MRRVFYSRLGCAAGRCRKRPRDGGTSSLLSWKPSPPLTHLQRHWLATKRSFTDPNADYRREQKGARDLGGPDRRSCSSSGKGGGSNDSGEDESTRERDRVWTIPNIITMTRMACCPALAGLIVTEHYEAAAAGLALASFSDWLDGFIARTYKQTSVLGGFLDPLADKVLMVSLTSSLLYQGLLPGLLGVVLIGRDVVLVGGSLLFRARTKKPEDAFFDVSSLDWKVTPSLLSKANTALQFSTLCLALTQQIYMFPGEAVLQSFFVATGCATVASGFNYYVDSGLRTNSALMRSIKHKKMLAVRKIQEVESIPLSTRIKMRERVEQQALMVSHVAKEVVKPRQKVTSGVSSGSASSSSAAKAVEKSGDGAQRHKGQRDKDLHSMDQG